MGIKISLKDESQVSKIATAIIFLALIRCISEPFRLQYFSATTLNFNDIKPFLIGSSVAALGLLVMTILSYFGRHRLIIVTSILIIVILLIVKMIYLVP